MTDTSLGCQQQLGTGPDFWEQKWVTVGAAEASLGVFGFERMLEAYLPRPQKGSPIDFLEIGCFPGRFLYYFAKEFGYRVFGIDFISRTKDINTYLKELGVGAQVEEVDFFKFSPKRGFDVVASFGFVEHFPNWQEVLDRHIRLLNPGGTLVIEFPNFRYCQYILLRIFNPSLLQGHYLELMEPSKWARALKERGLEVLYAGYHQTFDFRCAIKGRGFSTVVRKALLEFVRLMRRGINRLQIDYPSRIFSPYTFVIARLPASNSTSGS
jgi:SAM-dependent methyltransferase